MINREELLKSWKSDRRFLSTSALKVIASTAMLLSHLAQSFLLYGLGYIKLADTFMLIGRIAMPIFSFLLVQGIILTSDIKKYLARLLIFAFISEIFYDLAFTGTVFDFSRQNVFFTLFLAGTMLYIWQIAEEMDTFKKILLICLSFISVSLIAIAIKADYTYKVITAIGLLYFARNSKIMTGLAILLSFSFSRFTRGYAVYIPYMVYLSIPLIFLYNGQKGKSSKWGFYIFYPAHLLIIYILKIILL